MTARQLEYSSSLNRCAAVHYLTVFLSWTVLRTFDIQTFASSNPRIELALAANIVFSGRAVPYSRRVFKLGRILSLMTARQLEYPSSLNCCTTVHCLTVFLSQTVLRTYDIKEKCVF